MEAFPQFFTRTLKNRFYRSYPFIVHIVVIVFIIEITLKNSELLTFHHAIFLSRTPCGEFIATAIA
jgi:hypothetical protein